MVLPRHDSVDGRAASWRQAIAALSQSAGVGPPPLDGVEEVVLERAAHIAIADGFADQMDWIADDKAAVALYELTAALPQGRARRELGRRVFARLYEGPAATFAAVAQRMALGSGKPLENPTLRARVSLVLDLPLGAAVNAAPLALTLTTRRELHERWLERPSMGALPARRLAAKIYEHAAREALIRSQQGDPHGLNLLLSEELQPAFQRLLMDREPLVWQHAASARGLLSIVEPRVRAELETLLDPALSPTEWRRAAVSLVAALTGNSEEDFRACVRILEGELRDRDPGIAASMVLGLPRVIEAEPDRAEDFLLLLADTKRPDVAEAVAALLSDLAHQPFASAAVRGLVEVLTARASAEKSILRGIAARALRLLEAPAHQDKTLGQLVHEALLAYESAGAREAHELARLAASKAHEAQDFLEGHHPLDEESMPEVLEVLAELDASALERARLHDLLLLHRRPGDADASVPEMDGLMDRMGRWLLKGEREANDEDWSKPQALANQRRLKALLHLVDVDTAPANGGTIDVAERIRVTLQILLGRLAAGPDAMVHRIICACLARCFDAAVREGVAEPSDLVLLVATRLDDNHSVETIAEASTNFDVSRPIKALAKFMDPGLMDGSLGEATDTHSDPLIDISAMQRQEAEDLMRTAKRVTLLSQGVAASGSYRGEALRRVLFRLGHGLEAAVAARGLTELCDAQAGQSAIDEIEQSVDAFRKLAQSATRRLLDYDPSEIAVTTELPALSVLIERAVRSGVPANTNQLISAVSELASELPAALGSAIGHVLSRVQHLPVTPPSDLYAIPLERRRAPLPDWLLPRRTIGAFYVVRALGTGGVSSVFVARRLEERHDPRASTFALKVPEYDPTTARSVSEQEFLQLFREEAGALLSLPQHQNLARFVTFDLAARPKPILVMEHIRGTSLDRLIRSRSLTLDRCFEYLDGILAGLEAMHSAGVGHLDLKPSNVILRKGTTPVLVDFGLSGRHLRPGCGTLEYCAPEVLGVSPEDHVPTPAEADVYAFACTAFEILTGELLFNAEDEMALVSLQVSHDGWPDKLARLGRSQAFAELGVVLAACLRRDPRQRPTATEARSALAEAGRALYSANWPLGADEVTGISA